MSDGNGANKRAYSSRDEAAQPPKKKALMVTLKVPNTFLKVSHRKQHVCAKNQAMGRNQTSAKSATSLKPLLEEIPSRAMASRTPVLANGLGKAPSIFPALERSLLQLSNSSASAPQQPVVQQSVSARVSALVQAEVSKLEEDLSTEKRESQAFAEENQRLRQQIRTSEVALAAAQGDAVHFKKLSEAQKEDIEYLRKLAEFRKNSSAKLEAEHERLAREHAVVKENYRVLTAGVKEILGKVES